MEPLKERLGNKVKELRERRRLNQRELAELAGTTPPTLISIEKGRKTTDIDTLARIARQLGTTPAELLAEPGASQDTLREILVLLTALNESELNRTLAFLRGLKGEEPTLDEPSEPGQVG